MVFLGCYRSDPLSTRFLHGTEQLQEVVVRRMGVGVGMYGYEFEFEFDEDEDEDDCGYDCI